MNCMKLIGLNVKYYRYKLGWTQETLSNKTGLKIAYISNIERGKTNLTCKNIEILARTLKIDYELLFNKETAKKAINYAIRIDFQK